MIIFDVPDRCLYLKNELTQALKTVMDPELHVNIVDLGLVYAVAVDPDKKIISIEMTLSSRFCPMGESILSAVKNCIERYLDAFKAEVLLVWHPTWNYDFISPAGLSALRKGHQ